MRRVDSADELNVGDHVVWHRRFYDHHGIITNTKGGCEFEVIESANTTSGFFAASIFRGSILGGKAILKCSSIKFHVKYLSVVHYSYRFSKTKTAERAKQYYNESRMDPSSYNYNLFTNNCEHFATYCATGKMFSLQVATFLSGSMQSYIESILKPERRRNDVKCVKCICMPCKNIESKNDVNIGDIIKYLKDDIWHYAVVIMTHTHTTKTMKCVVVHHNSCGPFASKTIEREEIVVRFKDLFYKDIYASPDFRGTVYNPNVVQRRALSMIGKQKRFSNECSHFPIWCKIESCKDVYSGTYIQTICSTFDAK